MKTQRSALLGLVLGLAVFGAACEDKTEVVIPPEPDPPIVVTVTPQQLELQVGASATLAAAVTGGSATAAKTVTWSTSSAAIATVDATGKVTAVAAGVATIIATSTADPNAKAAAAVTVTPVVVPAQPSVSIKSITQFATTIPVALDNVFGQIDITLNLDVPTGSKISALRTYVNNTKVCEQTFSSGAEVGATEEVDGASDIVCSVNTAAYTGTPGTDNQATITFPNGPGYKVKAEIVGTQGTIVAQIVSADMIFKNPSFIVAVKKAPTNCTTGAVNSGATFWCGGDITVDFLPVNFSANANDVVNSITLVATGTTAGGPSTKTATDNAAGWSVTLQKASTPSASSVAAFEGATTLVVTSTTVGGQNGPTCINPDPVLNPIGFCAFNTWMLGTGQLPTTAFLVDNVAPANPLFDFRPVSNGGPLICNNTTACYIGNGFTFALGAKVTLWYNNTATVIGASDLGVSAGPVNVGLGITADFEAGTSTTTMAPVTAVSGLAETATASPDGYFLRVTLKDKLGNEAKYWAANATAGGTTSTNSANYQRIGVDNTAPVLAVDPSSLPVDAAPAAPGTWLTAGWTFAHTDISTAPAGPSGLPQPPGPFGTAAPLYHLVYYYAPTGSTTCYDWAGATQSCTTSGLVNWKLGGTGAPANTTVGIRNGTAVTHEGYHEVKAWLADLAYNTTTIPLYTRMALQDVTAPIIVGGISISPVPFAVGGAVTFSVSATDNVDLAYGWGRIGYTGLTVANGYGALSLPKSNVGTYGPTQFTTVGTVSATEPKLLKSIQDGFGGAIYIASLADLFAFDFGTNFATTQYAIPAASLGAAPQLNTGNAQMTSFQQSAGSPSVTTVCIDGSCNVNATSVTVTVESSGILGTGGQTYNNPFLGDFGAYVRSNVEPVGIANPGSLNKVAASVNITAADAGTVRTWKWVLTIPGTEIGKLFTCPTSGTTYAGEEIIVLGRAANGESIIVRVPGMTFACD